jgi:hypothetical protein
MIHLEDTIVETAGAGVGEGEGEREIRNQKSEIRNQKSEIRNDGMKSFYLKAFPIIVG